MVRAVETGSDALDHAHDRIVLAQPGRADDDADDRVLPVADEALAAGVEERHRRVLLGARLVDEVVVDDNLRVRARQVLALLRRVVRVLTGRALAAIRARGALEVLEFEIVDVLDDDAEDARVVARVGRRAERELLLVRVDLRALRRRRGRLLGLLRQARVLALVLGQLAVELGLLEVAGRSDAPEHHRRTRRSRSGGRTCRRRPGSP